MRTRRARPGRTLPWPQRRPRSAVDRARRARTIGRSARSCFWPTAAGAPARRTPATGSCGKVTLEEIAAPHRQQGRDAVVAVAHLGQNLRAVGLEVETAATHRVERSLSEFQRRDVELADTE